MNRYPINSKHLREALHLAWNEGLKPNAACAKMTKGAWINEMVDLMSSWELPLAWDRVREPEDGEKVCTACEGKGKYKIAGNYNLCGRCIGFGIQEKKRYEH